MSDSAGRAVVDASVFVDLLIGSDRASWARRRLAGLEMHAPAHVDLEVLSALGRLHRHGDLDEASVTRALAGLLAAPLMRHPLPDLLIEAWARRQALRLTDALYVALAEDLDVPLVTTDGRLARATDRAITP